MRQEQFSPSKFLSGQGLPFWPCLTYYRRTSNLVSVSITVLLWYLTMTSEHKTSVVSFKLDEQAKRRFDAAMRLEGTTVSETIRNAVLKYLKEVDEGVEHPQFRLDLPREGSESKGEQH